MKDFHLTARKVRTTSTTVMAKDSTKRVASWRLEPAVLEQLRQQSAVQSRPQNLIVQDALLDYFKAHPTPTRYSVVVTREQVLLMENDHGILRVRETKQRNGVTPDELQSQYAAQLHEPVLLSVSNEGSS